MLRSPASLVALALLLGAYVARAQHSATADPSAVTNVSYCALLANKTSEGAAVRAWRSVPVFGVPTIVTLLWDNELGHAAAVMLGVLLRHVHLYDGVHVSRALYSQVTAAKLGTNFTISSRYLVIAVSATWMPETRWSWQPKGGPYSWLGSNLRELGESTVPARRRLFAWLNPTARHRAACWEHMRWAFYANQTVFVDCDFVGAVNPQGVNLSAVELLGVGDCNTTLQQLQARATATKTTLHLRHVDRTAFVHILQTTNRSFLFLDYDMWKGVPGVIVVEPPPCVPIDFDCKQELDSAKAMLVADVDTLEVYAPQLLRLVQDFKPSPKSLRLILQRQASGVDIEEAGCEWALKNKNYLVVESNRLKYDKEKERYVAVTYLCLGDPSNLLYEFIINRLGKIIYDQMSIVRCNIELRRYFINCSDNYNMFNKVHKLTRTTDYYKLVGVVSMVVEGAAEASAIAAASHVPLMLADVVPEEGVDLTTWRVAGRPRHIARALQHFVRASDWTRIAVLFQSTKLAADYNAALKDKADIILGDFPIPDHLTEEQTQTLLRDLQNTNARIVFVNADSQAALTILTAAFAGGMGYTDGFVWIVREWQQNNVTCATNHFTVSFWDRGLEDIPVDDGWEGSQLRKKLRKVFAHPWPPRAVSLANALLTLIIGFKDIFRRFPYTRQDLHSAQIIRLLQESLIETPVAGVSQRLRYKERSLEEAFVFVDQWCGSEFKQRLATWRVNATSGEVRGNYSQPADLPHDDGTSACIVRSGDEFDPTCHDIECACALLLLALAPGAVFLARRALRRHLARLQQEQQIQVIVRRRHVTNVLAAYLVERAALELHEELGAGKFGSVRLARLREPAHAPRYIAVKALRDNAAAAEESEFLREACTIASLNHAHIVRLVGVCIADGPPLVLMELAFFGDLLGYLCARRYLVEGASSEASAETGEAEHVSAKALTRLAREAAEALQYLGMRGVVHRDVRAANCLVDVRRSLKLADFGMARNTVASADGAPEYSCRRRGLFPVLWMAPESLAHGVFTAASDVWALGVLVLELVTLGVRPYGTMSPLRVLEYVAAGGSPPLPLDATRQTRGLVQLCWAHEAERRPSAAEVAAYLASWPLALRPALLSERDEPANADSSRRKSSREVALHKAAAARLSSPLPRLA